MSDLPSKKGWPLGQADLGGFCSNFPVSRFVLGKISRASAWVCVPAHYAHAGARAKRERA